MEAEAESRGGTMNKQGDLRDRRRSREEKGRVRGNPMVQGARIGRLRGDRPKFGPVDRRLSSPFPVLHFEEQSPAQISCQNLILLPSPIFQV